jgi:glycosyltransferase involved in cell wall biosynthesis
MTIVFSYAAYKFTDAIEGVGGEERVAWETVSWFAERGHRVYVCSPQFALSRQYENLIPIEISDCDYKDEKRWTKKIQKVLRFDRQSRKAIRRIIQNETVDAVHHLCPAYPGFSSSVSKLSAPFVYGPATVQYDRKIEGVRSSTIKRVFTVVYGVIKRFRYAKTLRQAARVLVEVDYARRYLPRRIRSEAITLYNSIETQDYDPKRTIGAGAEALQSTEILYHGGIRSNKGIEVLLRAIAVLINDRQQSCRATLIGPIHNPAIPQLAKDLGISEHIDFLPPVPYTHIRSVLDRKALYVFPTLQDNCPKGLLEAMAMGHPIITSDVMDIPLIVRDGVDGVIVPSGDPIALADAIVDLTADPGRQKALAKSALDRVRRDFDRQKRMIELEKLYQSLE